MFVCIYSCLNVDHISFDLVKVLATKLLPSIVISKRCPNVVNVFNKGYLKFIDE